MSIRAAQDSFVKFMAGGLPGITVNVLRREEDNRPEGEVLQLNAVNISFLSDDLQVSVAGMVVSLDILHDNEYTAIDMKQRIWEVLSAAFFTPKLDYEDPLNPEPLGTNMFWDNRSVRFTKLYNHNYTHFTCRLPIFHHV